MVPCPAAGADGGPGGRLEGHRLLERGPAGGPAQRPEHRPAGDQHEHGGGDGAPDVPAEAGREGEDEEPVEVLEHRRTGDERQVAAHPGGERPERQVEQQAVGEAATAPYAASMSDLGAAAQRRQQPGAQPTQRGAEHLERQPRPDPAGEQRRGEQGRGAEHEPEAGPNTRPPRTSRKNTSLDAGGAGAERPQRGADGGEHAEHRDGLDVHAALAHLGEHDGDHQRQHERRRRTGRRCRAPARSRVRRAAASRTHQPGDRDERDGGERARPQPQAPGCAALMTPPPRGPSRTSSTVSQGPGARTLVTCGANAGDATTTSAVGPVGDDLALGQHDDPVGHLGDELHVVGRHHDRAAVAPRGRAGPGQRAPWPA